jgi:hypothetical protein
MLADQLADAVKRSLGAMGDAGFSYLRSHGAIDVEHTALFRNLINGFEDRETQDLIIEATRVMYRLYGAIFEDLGARYGSTAHAA